MLRVGYLVRCGDLQGHDELLLRRYTIHHRALSYRLRIASFALLEVQELVIALRARIQSFVFSDRQNLHKIMSCLLSTRRHPHIHGLYFAH